MNGNKYFLVLQIIMVIGAATLLTGVALGGVSCSVEKLDIADTQIGGGTYTPPIDSGGIRAQVNCCPPPEQNDCPPKAAVPYELRKHWEDEGGSADCFAKEPTSGLKCAITCYSKFVHKPGGSGDEYAGEDTFSVPCKHVIEHYYGWVKWERWREQFRFHEKCTWTFPPPVGEQTGEINEVCYRDRIVKYEGLMSVNDVDCSSWTTCSNP